MYFGLNGRGWLCPNIDYNYTTVHASFIVNNTCYRMNGTYNITTAIDVFFKFVVKAEKYSYN